MACLRTFYKTEKNNSQSMKTFNILWQIRKFTDDLVKKVY